jgi:hypothetical protein
MNTKASYRKATLGAAALGAIFFAVAAGCNQSQAAPTPASTGTAQTPTPAAGPRVDAPNYAIEMKAAGPYKAGQEGTVLLTLVSKGDYHINPQYPYRVKLAEGTPNVTYPKPVLQRADGTFEEKRASFKVPFVAAKAGKATIKGTLSLSVCSEANCLMEKQELELGVDVN